MARAAEQQAKGTYGQASAAGSQAGQNANSIFGTLLPQYEKEAAAPEGFAPGEKAEMMTAAAGSTGGSTAGAIGRNNLIAARTRNRGGFQIANDEAAREGGRQLSSDVLGVDNEDARLKKEESSEGLRGMAGLYGQNENALMESLGAENNSTNNLINAGKSGWLQNTLGVLGALGQGASGAGSILTGIK
jgi:hypothetical protein